MLSMLLSTGWHKIVQLQQEEIAPAGNLKYEGLRMTANQKDMSNMEEV